MCTTDWCPTRQSICKIEHMPSARGVPGVCSDVPPYPRALTAEAHPNWRSDASKSSSASSPEYALPVPGLIWSGLVWAGLGWSGLGWSGLVWPALAWSGLVWSGLVWSGLVWSGLVWSGLVWSGLVWSGLVWSGLSGLICLVWSGLVCAILYTVPPVWCGGAAILGPDRVGHPISQRSGRAQQRLTPAATQCRELEGPLWEKRQRTRATRHKRFGEAGAGRARCIDDDVHPAASRRAPHGK
eukprot:gene17899-biopygen3893